MTVLRHPNNQGVTLSQWRKTAAGGETSLSGTDDFSAGLAYTAGAEQVFVNGVLLERGVDYTASTGTTVTGLTALVAGDIVTVSSPSAFNVANAIPLSTVTAKGDLLAATGASTVTNLPVGADGTTLVADSSTSTGLRYTNLFGANKNKILNGDFYINQRAFTSNTTTGAYNFDRFLEVNSGGTVTVTPQLFTAGAAPVSGYEATNYVRVVTASQSAAGDYALFGQKIEDVRTLAGQTATVSFWAKAASGTPKIGVALDQYFGTGGAASATITNAAATQTLTTSWVRYSFTITVPSISGKTIGTANNSSLSLYIVTSTGATLVAAGYPNTGIQNITADIWGVQVEAGSVATAFQTATGTFQGELAACQRYLPKLTVTSSIVGMVTSTTQSYYSFKLPVTARVAPTSTTVSALSDFKVFNASLANGTPTAINFNDGGTDYVSVGVTTTAGSPTIATGQCALLTLNNAGGYILFNGCEL